MKYIKVSILFIVLLCCTLANAQSNDTLDIQKNEKGKVKFARFQSNASSNRRMQNDTVFLKSILQAKKEDSFRKIKEDLDELGITHKKFQQYYKGLKVENSEFLIHGKNDNIEVINGDFNDIDISIIKPSLNESQALTKALSYVGSKKYKWEDTAMEKFVKQNTNNPNATYYPKGELVISKGHLNGSNSWKLSWKFIISSMEPNNEQIIYVDATNADIINNVPLIYDANTTCTAQTRYNTTTQNITGDSYSGGYRLFETRNTTSGHNANIHTWNCLSQPNYSSAVEFSNTNTNWTLGSWPSINQDQVALDAHWGEEKILDYWSNVHTRNSLDNLGKTITGYVHFYQAGTNAGWPNNAQWDGNNYIMRYGDGDGIIFNPLTALDVVAHEMGHGINQFTANLHSLASNEECDALNEGFSDIWAACVEHWAAPNKQTWLMGEEIFSNGIFSCIRDLQNPKSFTASEGQHPDTYHGNFWSNVGEPHFNSTVLSHWFYLLSQGSNGIQTNELGNSYNIVGISIENAQKIAYRAESLYLYSSADYSAARNATIQAAADLASSIPNAISEVTNAWYAVGVGGQYQYIISGPSYVCPSSTITFTVVNPPVDFTWVCSGSLSLVSSSGNSATFYAGSTPGTASVSVKVGDVIVASKTITIGNASISISGPDFILSGSNGQYAPEAPCLLAGPYTWSLINSNDVLDIQTITTGRPTVSVVSKSGGVQGSLAAYRLVLSVGGLEHRKHINGDYGQKFVFNSSGPIIQPDFSIYPNPATDLLTVELTASGTEENSIMLSRTTNTTATPYTIQLWNETRGLVRTVEGTERVQQVSLQGLPKGMYFVHLIVGEQTVQRKILFVN